MYKDYGYGTGKLGAELRDLDAEAAPYATAHKIIVGIAVVVFVAALIIMVLV